MEGAAEQCQGEEGLLEDDGGRTQAEGSPFCYQESVAGNCIWIGSSLFIQSLRQYNIIIVM